MCFDEPMKIAVRRTAMIPVTTMEEVPVLSEAERADMVASLKAAEAQITAEQFTVHDPRTFVARMMKIYRAAKTAKAGRKTSRPEFENQKAPEI